MTTREQWAKREERWDRWYSETLADLRARAAQGEVYATRVLQRYDVLNRSGVKGRPALNRTLREIGRE